MGGVPRDVRWVVGLQPESARNLGPDGIARLETIGRDNMEAVIGDVETALNIVIVPSWSGRSGDIYTEELLGVDVLRLENPPPPGQFRGSTSQYWAELHCGDCGFPMIALPIPSLEDLSTRGPAYPWSRIAAIWCPTCGWAMGTFGLLEPTPPPGYVALYRYVDRDTATAIVLARRTDPPRPQSRSRSRSAGRPQHESGQASVNGLGRPRPKSRSRSRSAGRPQHESGQASVNGNRDLPRGPGSRQFIRLFLATGAVLPESSRRGCHLTIPGLIVPTVNTSSDESADRVSRNGDREA